MNQHHKDTKTVVAILGTGTLSEMNLAQLLREEGYDTRLLEAQHTGLIEEWLDGADVLLIPGQEDDRHTASLLRTMRSIPHAASIPLLPFSATLRMALLD